MSIVRQREGVWANRPRNILPLRGNDGISMDYSYLALKFLIGGGVIVGITFLAEQVDPKYGGNFCRSPDNNNPCIPFYLFRCRAGDNEATGDGIILVCHPDPALPLGALPSHVPLPPHTQFWRGIWGLACGSPRDEPAAAWHLRSRVFPQNKKREICRQPDVLDLPEVPPLFHKPVPVPRFVKNIYNYILNPADPESLSLHLPGKVIGEGAGFAGKSHVDLHAGALYPYFFYETKINDVDTYLRINYFLQCIPNFVLADNLLPDLGGDWAWLRLFERAETFFQSGSVDPAAGSPHGA